jgi:hypothetical protein
MGAATERINFELDHIKLSIFGNFVSHDDFFLHGLADDLAEDAPVCSADVVLQVFLYLRLVLAIP